MMLIGILAFASAGAGQDANGYRGGWRTDRGEAHTHEFSIRDATVRGVYCTYCVQPSSILECTRYLPVLERIRDRERAKAAGAPATEK